MPSSRKVQRALFEALPSDLKTIYELGSGWGHLAFSLANHCPEARVVGYELSWVPFLVSRLAQRLFSLPNLRLIRRDFFASSLEEADLVICYLFSGAMKRLKPKFEKELRPGSLVISNTFAIPGWTAERMILIKGIWPTTIYIYRVSS